MVKIARITNKSQPFQISIASVIFCEKCFPLIKPGGLNDETRCKRDANYTFQLVIYFFQLEG